jgi:hypothetical protein
MGSWLNRIQELYSSTDPSERPRGVIGKALVEAVYIISMSAIILAPLFGVHIFVAEIDPLSLPLADVSVPVAVTGYFTKQFMCNIIIDSQTSEN